MIVSNAQLNSALAVIQMKEVGKKNEDIDNAYGDFAKAVSQMKKQKRKMEITTK